MYGFFDRFRITGDPAARDHWADTIARDCQGWPQHLHMGLQALARGVTADGVGGEPAKVDQDAVFAWGRQEREDYYQRRLKNSRVQDRRMLAAYALARLTGTTQAMAKEDLGEAVRCLAARMGPSVPWLRLPDGVDGEQFVDNLIRAGLLHQDSVGCLTVPIPSFVTCLQATWPNAFELSDLEREQDMMRGDEGHAGAVTP